MKPRDMKFFTQVEAVIGEDFAEYELQRVIDFPEYEMSVRNNFDISFIWICTPQGRSFWDDINKGISPYDHGHKKPDLSEITPANSDKETELSEYTNTWTSWEPLLPATKTETGDKQRSDGSTASYYELPKGATELQHLISHRNQNGQIAEIFRACYRYGLVSHSDMLRDAKKIKFYAQAEIERLEKLEQTNQG